MFNEKILNAINLTGNVRLVSLCKNGFNITDVFRPNIHYLSIEYETIIRLLSLRSNPRNEQAV